MKNYFYLLFITVLIFSSCFKDGLDQDTVYTEGAIFGFDSSKLITLKSGAIVEKKSDQYIWLGDIILSKEQLKSLDETGDIFKNASDKTGPNTNTHPSTGLPMDVFTSKTTARSVGISPTSYNLWAMVRYVISPSLTWDRLDIVNQAIAHWEATTNVRFYNATGQPTHDPVYGFAYPYVEFVNSNVNRSTVGRSSQGGKQILELAQYQPARAAIHEIGHAIGLLHEQVRNDRDMSIDINWANIIDSAEHNFQKRTSNYYMMGSIDYSSVMMYPSFISDGSMVHNTNEWVMRRKDQTTWTPGSVLSNSDRSWANSFYLPYKARTDTYRELADVVYKSDNSIMTAAERCQLQASLNNGNPCPPGTICPPCGGGPGGPGGIE